MDKISSEMCDFQEFYLDIANSLPDDCVIAEVGVADGYSALLLASMLNNFKKKFTLYMIDNMDYGREEQLNTLIRNITASGQSYNINLLAYSSLDASCKFPDGHFDMVFLDSSHTYEQTKAEIRQWYHKIKEGGLLAGHDYNMLEVHSAVNEVIPETFTRQPIPNGEHPPYEKAEVYFQELFKPEPCRQVFETEKKLGVWAVRKKFYLKLN